MSRLKADLEQERGGTQWLLTENRDLTVTVFDVSRLGTGGLVGT